MKLTKEEAIREIERDIEAVIFNYQEQRRQEGEDLPDWRRGDFEHLIRALGLIDYYLK